MKETYLLTAKLGRLVQKTMDDLQSKAALIEVDIPNTIFNPSQPLEPVDFTQTDLLLDLWSYR